MATPAAMRPRFLSGETISGAGVSWVQRGGEGGGQVRKGGGDPQPSFQAVPAGDGSTGRLHGPSVPVPRANGREAARDHDASPWWAFASGQGWEGIRGPARVQRVTNDAGPEESRTRHRAVASVHEVRFCTRAIGKSRRPETAWRCPRSCGVDVNHHERIRHSLA